METESVRVSVSIDEIDRQRELGWPDFHPEDYCHRCGGRNIPSWHVDSDRWNVALGAAVDPEWQGILCPGCFVTLHEEATGLRCTWKLAPDPMTPFRPIKRSLDDDIVSAPVTASSFVTMDDPYKQRPR